MLDYLPALCIIDAMSPYILPMLFAILPILALAANFHYISGLRKELNDTQASVIRLVNKWGEDYNHLTSLALASGFTEDEIDEALQDEVSLEILANLIFSKVPVAKSATSPVGVSSIPAADSLLPPGAMTIQACIKSTHKPWEPDDAA